MAATKVVIVGAGAVGFQLAKQLISENKDVVLIEKDPEVARFVASKLDCMVVTGEGNKIETLRRAGTDGARYFISVADSDEVNMIACGIVSSEFNVEYKVARVRSVEYAETKISQKGFLGIDYLVNPEIEAARAIIRSIEHGAVSDIMLFERSNVQIRNITVDRLSPFQNKSLIEIDRSIDVSFLVALVLRQNRFIIPSGDTVICEGDILYIAAKEDALDRLFSSIGKQRSGLRRVVIVGGGTIGTLVAESLLGVKRETGFMRRLLTSLSPSYGKRSVKIVERDYRRCKELADRFHDGLVINADISDEGIFEEEHFANSDLVIATTDNQELNIVTAIYAKSFGIKRSIVLVNKGNYSDIATHLGIDVAVSLKNAMVNTILKYVRRGNVRSVHSISDGQMEVLELTVESNSRAVGKRVEDLNLPKDSLIVSISRESETLIPDGKNMIYDDDHIILLTEKSKAEKVESLFTAAR
ncbi:MAG: Trk system potassium transporter TrkA [Spirochaetaceae bacterium]